jgi:hypothetical protein
LIFQFPDFWSLRNSPQTTFTFLYRGFVASAILSSIVRALPNDIASPPSSAVADTSPITTHFFEMLGAIPILKRLPPIEVYFDKTSRKTLLYGIFSPFSSGRLERSLFNIAKIIMKLKLYWL